MQEKLTRKEKLFIDEYMIDFNASRAARAAGYSKNKAGSIGSELTKKPEIIKEIDRQFDQRRNKRKFAAEKILKELEFIAFARMKNYVSFKSGRMNIVDTDDLEPGQDAAIQQYSETETQHGGSASVKLYDKVKALELYAKLLNLFPKEEVKPSGEIGMEQEKAIDAKLTPAEYLKILQERNAVSKTS